MPSGFSFQVDGMCYYVQYSRLQTSETRASTSEWCEVSTQWTASSTRLPNFHNASSGNLNSISFSQMWLAPSLKATQSMDGECP